MLLKITYVRKYTWSELRTLAWKTPQKATNAREDVQLSSVSANSPQGAVTVSKKRRRVSIVEPIL